MPDLVFRDLGKFEFLRRNRAQIDSYRDQVSGAMRQRYGDEFQPLSIEDVWVITNCEAGVSRRSGKVDPRFVHSLGEVGFYPLPANIADWNGRGAPAWNRPMPIETNVLHYFLYLGHLKNKSVKTVGGLRLYRDLFRRPTGADKPTYDAKVLAGVVHGYFFSGNYRDRTIPLQHLADGYDRDVGLADMMRLTKFVHAGTDIISNRGKNIASALLELRRIGR